MTSSGLSRIGAGSRIGIAITVFTQLAGWSVALAGIAILQQCCNSNNRDFHTSTGLFGLGPNVFEQSIVGAPGAVPLGQPSGYDCGMQYSWYWWVLALQFVCVIAGIFPAIIPFSGSKLLLVALYAIVTTHWCILAYAMNWMTYVYQRWGSDYNAESRWRTGYTTAYAGAIIVLVANFAYLFNLAAEEMAKEVAEGRGPGQHAGGKNIDTPEVGTAGPGTTTTLAV